MVPVVDRLKDDYEGKVDFQILDVEKDAEASELFDSLGLQFVPSFVFMHSDGSESETLVGEQTEEQMKAALDKLH